MMSRYADDSARTISTKLKRSRVHPGADAPHDGLLDRIRNVIPLIAEKADEVESLCQPHDEVMEALQSTGVFKAFVPKAYGGYEIDLQEFIDIGLEVAQACCSTGWLTTFYMEHNWIVAAVLSDEAVDAIYSKQPYVLAPGSINPKGGEAAKVEGGYELSGRWHFSSGIVHGDWVILTAFLPGDPKGFRELSCYLGKTCGWKIPGISLACVEPVVMTRSLTECSSLICLPALFLRPGAEVTITSTLICIAYR